MENLKNFEEFTENESWKTWAAGAALGTSLLTSSPSFANTSNRDGDNPGKEMIQQKKYNKLQKVDFKEALDMAKKLKGVPGNMPPKMFFEENKNYNVVLVNAQTQTAANLSITQQLSGSGVGSIYIMRIEDSGNYVGFQQSR